MRRVSSIASKEPAEQERCCVDQCVLGTWGEWRVFSLCCILFPTEKFEHSYSTISRVTFNNDDMWFYHLHCCLSSVNFTRLDRCRQIIEIENHVAVDSLRGQKKALAKSLADPKGWESTATGCGRNAISSTGNNWNLEIPEYGSFALFKNFSLQ
jgi:hypothetical protein